MAGVSETTITTITEAFGARSLHDSDHRINAATLVFGTYELTENILLQLPLEDLLLVSNTSNFVRQVVESSKAIIFRFDQRSGGYLKEFELHQGDSWSQDIAFAFRTDLRGAQRDEIRMFVSRKEECEAIGILNRGRKMLKVMNGVNVQVTFQRFQRHRWHVAVRDMELDQNYSTILEATRYPQDQDMVLTWYSIRFHGAPRFGYPELRPRLRP